MPWFAQAPANIALIKYMGKQDEGNNIPDNPSLSYTLNNLLTSVQLEHHHGKDDIWEPLPFPGQKPFSLSEPAQQRYLKHLAFLKKSFDYEGAFRVRSSNNFPHGSGLASSASSFAALTLCAVKALSELSGKPLPPIEDQAKLSRVGSGSSCRSFFSPWAIWEGETVKGIALPYQELIHQVVIISHAEKEVPSSQAHRRIKSSPFYPNRSHRASDNLNALLNAFHAKDWKSAYEICWREFQDMHRLFSTCEKPFTYMTEQGDKILNELQDFWQREGDGPLVTMDAGPNIHLLYRVDQADLARQFKQDHLAGHYDVL
ncbi:diphosphomevalonate decarboxylase [Legionella taurinensis]|uniref:Diphosphomevalonate decarboxylase n=1 Tax=Legionella taurinensis TaxID=70611 RepID=A0A3A5L3G9_9GAMM|nr:diphosphomevalonate decarboxylase [Legionella taurinensis]MDX1838649.1 diphosphomevalonate decarboxylase [Legionella taurinensis]PUT38842.1 diphosphomevalonate decarboxylase [Legionella taurinensis]PUT40160.1 diphosphomevalonate decarboxylase [Legionella taurinensis]PUT42466.1 diphosphomevalonate decarboxylase [Legionella taurinensis]PUT45886.1 diphosphomevalonate decarboxylase [Legionella taurinensis]